jgi:hypothetical protein
MPMLSLSTMWAQQDRFADDMHRFVHEARDLGYDAIEVSHSCGETAFQRLIAHPDVVISSIHAPAPLVPDARGCANSALNLAALDEDERRAAIDYARCSIDFAERTGAR